MGFEEKNREKTEETPIMEFIVMKCGENDEENDGFSYGAGFDFAKACCLCFILALYMAFRLWFFHNDFYVPPCFCPFSFFLFLGYLILIYRRQSWCS
jgi:hypothetical protein